ncbi:mechanosensitive ion channel protein MscS [Synergistales bacterium]|nr:mechanosensitive ion channel protein MscS [Synergistales bacterium]
MNLEAEILSKIMKADLYGMIWFAARPLITLAVWFAADRLLWRLHKKSKFIENMFTKVTHDERQSLMIQQRVSTFRGLFLHSVRFLNLIFFLFILLGCFNIDPKPLLTGIGVVGLGLSLAAQNILRDFLTGLFVIIEDQYNVGDWVTINSASGTVESFTMRVTRLRATDGRLITIPNGGISQVANSTKKFSVAVVEVGVSYNTDVRYAMEVLGECCAAARDTFGGDMIEAPTAQGILSFGDSDVRLRALIKTLPGRQWAIERELRVIIKEKFEKVGIEIPFPQLDVHRKER